MRIMADEQPLILHSSFCIPFGGTHMTAIPQPGSLRLISERIVKPLRDVAARQWNVLAATGVLKSLVLALSLLLVTALLLGTFGGLPVPVRVALAGAARAPVLLAP